MNWTPKQSCTVLALAGLLTCSLGARADLGPIQVLSHDEQQFTALIPFVGTAPDKALVVSLADRNLYPMLSPYSPSAKELTIMLRKNLDGSPAGIVVMGPARFAEPALRFAVAISWPAGGAVREYEVDDHYALSEPRPPAPAPRDDGKKAVAAAHSFPLWSDLGLGGLNVKSQPGEPLLAETEVFGHALDRQHSLHVRILAQGAPGQSPTPQMRQRVASMRHQLLRTPSGGHLLQLSSAQPIPGPVFSFSLEVSLGGAHMLRRYVLEEKQGVFLVSEHTVSGRASGFKVLRVLPGDSLSQIASRMRHSGLSLAAIMQRLYQENPQAFIAGDSNKLLAEAQLKYPESWRNADSEPLAANARPQPAPAAAPAQSSVLAKPPASAKPPVAATTLPPVSSLPRNPAPAAAGKTRDLITQLQQQDAQLARAQQLSSALESRLRDLQSQPRQLVADVAPSRRKDSGRRELAPALIEGGAALAATAALAAVALLHRRRRRKAAAAGADTGASSPSIEGMRIWLRNDPTRDDLRYRLLQLLAIGDDPEGFIAEAEQARARFGEDSPMWRGVVEMGKALAPHYPWDAPAAVAEASAVQAEPTPAQEYLPTQDAMPVQEHTLAPAQPLQPERPLTEEGDWDAFAPSEIEFRGPEAEAAPEFEPLHEPDKRELAKLYLEMGDAETAQQIMQSQAPDPAAPTPAVSPEERPYRPRFF